MSDPVGLECPRCGCRHFYTLQTRQRSDMVLRRKECRHCGARVTTREAMVGSSKPESEA